MRVILRKYYLIYSAYKKKNNQAESLKSLLFLNEDTHNPDVLIAAAELMAAKSGELAVAEFVAVEVVVGRPSY